MLNSPSTLRCVIRSKPKHGQCKRAARAVARAANLVLIPCRSALGRHPMPRRHILTERQRRTLLALPTDDASLLKHYTLAEDNLEHIRHRRRAHNRLGFALQLCALR